MKRRLIYLHAVGYSVRFDCSVKKIQQKKEFYEFLIGKLFIDIKNVFAPD